MRPQAQINAAMCALMREVRLLLSPAQSTARERIAESRQERAKAALRQWREAGRMPPFSGRRQPRKGGKRCSLPTPQLPRSAEHTYDFQSLMRISYDVLCLKKQKTTRQ